MHRILVLLYLLLTTIQRTAGYDWEEWDLYQILGLQGQGNSATTANATTIKQAYRRQAKAWHPDKIQNQDDKQEATERFRRIAEAYQVLSDPEQKAMYDQFLGSSSSTSQASSTSPTESTEKSFFSWDTFRDPIKVFEEFFFAQNNSDDTDEHDWWYGRAATNDPWENYDDARNNNHEESWYYHPQFGQVLRVTKYEGENTFYQDFVEDWDPYRGTWGWYPLYPQPKFLRPKLRLEPHDVLSPPAVLRRGPFTAGFFDNCQLQIRRDTTVIWQALDKDDAPFSTGRYPHYQNQCRLTLYRSRLVLHFNGRPVWTTPTGREEGVLNGGYRPRFEAHLEDDGSLTVYQTDTMDESSLDLLDKVQRWIWKDPKCCYSTNPAGCHRLGRLLVRILTLNRRLSKLVQQVGALLNRVLDWLEGDEDDFDH